MKAAGGVSLKMRLIAREFLICLVILFIIGGLKAYNPKLYRKLCNKASPIVYLRPWFVTLLELRDADCKFLTTGFVIQLRKIARVC